MTDCGLIDRRLLFLARRAGAAVHTNPQVGAIITDHHLHILAEGWHHAYGEPHAEPAAIQNAESRYPHDDSPLSQSCLHISLEPCNIHGKTPPCTALILDKQIPRVRVMEKDPNPHMQGKSMEILKNAGVHATYSDTQISNTITRPFTINQTFRRPYVILKYAQSNDGFIGSLDRRIKISNPLVDVLVHKWRSKANAILIGGNTLVVDNPRLDNRHYFGPDPKPVVWIGRWSEDVAKSYLAKQVDDTLFFTYIQDETQYNTRLFYAAHVETLLSRLYIECQISILLVEGGAATLQRFIDAGLWDEIRTITNTSLTLAAGVPAPVFNGVQTDMVSIRDNRIECYFPASKIP